MWLFIGKMGLNGQVDNRIVAKVEPPLIRSFSASDPTSLLGPLNAGDGCLAGFRDLGKSWVSGKETNPRSNLNGLNNSPLFSILPWVLSLFFYSYQVSALFP